MDKTFKITGKVEFDDQDFNRSIDQMQKKLREIYAPGEIARAQNATNTRMAGSGMGGGFQPMNPGNTIQARRELDQMTIAQNRTNQALAQRIVERLNNEAKISKMIKDNNNLSKEEVGILEAKLKANQEITTQLMQQHSVRRQLVEKALSDKERRQANMNNILQGRGYQLDGMDFDDSGKRPAGKGARGVGEAVSMAKDLGKTALAVMALAAAGNALINSYYGMPIQATSATGAATQGFVGDQLGALAGGDVVGTQAFSGERAKAMQMAAEKNQGRFRSALPTSTSQIMPWLMGGVTGETDAFYAEKAKAQSEDYKTALQGMMEKEPLKIQAANRLQKNMSRDLSIQRQLGLSFGTYHGPGGFLETATGKGDFTEQSAVQMQQSIMGAGGSTRMGRAPVGGLQLQSGMNLTNISQILGKISGQTGNAGLAQQITEKMLEEAVRRGFSRSEFTEEFRQFADMAGTIIASSGAQTMQDATRLTQGLGRFVGDNVTPGGLAGAKSAYEEYQQQSSATGGRMGALQYAQMLQDPTLGKLGAQGIGGLMEMPEEDLNEQNIMVRAQAAKANVKPGDIVTAAAKVKRQLPGIAVGLGTTEMDKVDKYFEQNGLDESTVDINALPGDIKATYIKMIESGTTIGGYGGTQKAEARTRGMRKGFAGPGGGVAGGTNPIEESKRDLTPAEQIRIAKQQAAAGQTGKAEDEIERSMAKANQKFLENFRDYAKVIGPASDALDAFTGKIIAFTKAFQNAPDTAKPFILTNTGTKAPTQQQAGKPSAK